MAELSNLEPTSQIGSVKLLTLLGVAPKQVSHQDARGKGAMWGGRQLGIDPDLDVDVAEDGSAETIKRESCGLNCLDQPAALPILIEQRIA